MKNIEQYIPFIIAALSGIGAVLLNTKKDFDNTKPIRYFNKPTLSGYLVILIVLLSLSFSIYKSKKDKTDKDKETVRLQIEKEKQLEYQTNTILFLNDQLSMSKLLAAKSDSNIMLIEQRYKDQILYHQKENELFNYKLEIGSIKIDTLSSQNLDLKKQLNKQSEIANFAILNQSMVKPTVEIVLQLKTGLMDDNGYQEFQGFKIAHPDADVSFYRFASKNTRNFLFPEYNQIGYVDTSKSRPIGFIGLNFDNNLDFSFSFNQNGMIDYGLTENPFQFEIQNGSIVIHSTSGKEINAAVLYQNLIKTDRGFAINYYIKNECSDEKINKELTQLLQKIKGITLKVSLNDEAGLGFIIPLKFERFGIDKNNDDFKWGFLEWKVNGISKLEHIN